MSRRSLLGFGTSVLATILTCPHSARAVPFDLAHVHSMGVTLCGGCGITLSAWGFALLVNTGPLPITSADIDGMQFTATSTVDGISLSPFAGQLYLHAPIAPDEAVGSVIPEYNGLLVDLLENDESFRNTATSQVLPFQISRESGNTYEGPVTFWVTVTMGTEIAAFPIHATLSLGSHHIEFLTASRATSTSSTTVDRASWGELKTRYR